MSIADYAYLNARVRAMAADLLPPDFFDQVRTADGTEVLVDALLASAYAPFLRAELLNAGGIPAIERTVSARITAVLNKLRAVSPPAVRRLLDVAFRYWDAENLVAVVRGLALHAGPEEIARSLFPTGALPAARLSELVRQPGLDGLADALSTGDYPFAAELRAALRSGAAATDVAGLEAALAVDYFRWALAQLDPGSTDDATVASMLRLQIDLANVMAALDRVRHRERGDAVAARDPIAGGGLDPQRLSALAESPRLLDAFVLLAGTPFAPAAATAARAAGGGGGLARAARHLEAVVIAAGCRLFRRDPLGVAVPLGFLWRVLREMVNLRVLARGKAHRMGAAAIAEELVLA